MQDSRKHIIPGWTWSLLAIALVALTLMLFMTDQTTDPGPALVYDIAEYEEVDDADIRYHETARITLALDEVTGVASTTDGRLVVVGDRALLILDSNGTEQARHDLATRPHCVATGPDDVIYVGMRDSVTAMTAEAAEVVSWSVPVEGVWLTAIAVNEENVFVADAHNKRVLRFDHVGQLLGTIDGRDGDPTAHGFVVPSNYLSVALDAMNALWITNPGKLGVEKYREDGTRLTAWHQPGFSVDAFPGCCNPIHIAFTSDSALITAEKGLNRVKRFAADRSFDGVVAPSEMVNADWNPAEFPANTTPIRGLAVDSDDRILVVHGPLRALMIFELTAEGKDN